MRLIAQVLGGLALQGHHLWDEDLGPHPAGDRRRTGSARHRRAPACQRRTRSGVPSADISLTSRVDITVFPQVKAINGGEPACTPDSVPRAPCGGPRWRPSLSAGGCPPALAAYPGVLVGRAALPLSGLAPGGVYRAARVTPGAGALLPHRCTLTCAAPPGVCRHRRSTFCGTVLRVAPTGYYPAPCPVESGRSSDRSPSPEERTRHAAARPAHHHAPCYRPGALASLARFGPFCQG